MNPNPKEDPVEEFLSSLKKSSFRLTEEDWERMRAELEYGEGIDDDDAQKLFDHAQNVDHELRGTRAACNTHLRREREAERRLNKWIDELKGLEEMIEEKSKKDAVGTVGIVSQFCEAIKVVNQLHEAVECHEHEGIDDAVAALQVSVQAQNPTTIGVLRKLAWDEDSENEVRVLAFEALVSGDLTKCEFREPVEKLMRWFLDSSENELCFSAIACLSQLSQESRKRFNDRVRELAEEDYGAVDVRRAAKTYLRLFCA